MTTIAQDISNDIRLDADGLLALNTGRLAYGDIIRAAVQTLAGEIQLDANLGIPYMETVFSSAGGVEAWRVAVSSRITSFPFVVGIVNFSTGISGRTLQYKITVMTDDGIVEVENVR